MRTRVLLVAGAVGALVFAADAARADLVYAAVQDEGLNAVALLTPSLGFVNQVSTDGPNLALTAGVNNDFYISVGNSIDHYSDSGTLLDQITGGPTTVASELSFGNGMVYAAVQFEGTNEVVMFSPSLQDLDQVTIDGSILGLTAGVNNDFYISVGNSIDHYSDSGTLLDQITGGPTTVASALSFGNGMVYAAVQFEGTNEVVMFSPSLQDLDQVAIDGSILGLTAGVNNDFYISVGNSIDRYSDSGTLLGQTFGSPTTVVPALSYGQSPVSVPEPSSLAIVSATLLIVRWATRRRLVTTK